VEWPQPIIELLGFVAAFLVTGAIGFRYFVLRSWAGGRGAAGPNDLREVGQGAARRAALLGLLGALAALALLLVDINGQAVEHQTSLLALLGADGATSLEVGLGVATILGFALAMGGIGPGWLLAAAGVVLGVFEPAFFGKWTRLVNPIHMFAGGLWIGTLFHLVVAGIVPTLRSGLSSERRGALVQEMVARFSPFALASAGILATFGVITAWRHLHTLAALWTTPYGIALIVKLLVVGCVLALGAFNWKRQRPLLGTEAGARSLRRSASAELAVAAVVLVITSVLVSLPSPRPPGQGRPPAGQAK
jgi:putative copper export protein